MLFADTSRAIWTCELLRNVVRWDVTLVECGRENIGFVTSRNA
eukprot:COSAG02_NODE_5832_length_4004_cov_2.835339_1_plen_42_part_10